MSDSSYVVRRRADRDLDEQAYYYATEASAAVGHRFLVAAHDTFAVLATQPKMGWQPRLRDPELKHLRVFRVRGFERMLILYARQPMASKSCKHFCTSPRMAPQARELPPMANRA